MIHAATLLLAALCLGATAAPAQEFHFLPVPYVPTQMEAVRAMLSLARVAPGDVVYDLGSGDGRIVIVAAAQHGASGVGFELDEELVALSRRTAREVGVADRVRFESADLFEADLSPATVVTLYLSPDFNLLLRPRLLEQLRPGTRVVSHDFHMGDWEPDSVVHVRRGFSQTSVYLWTIPARVDGFWYLEIDGGGSFALELEQEYQRVAGAARADGVQRPLYGAVLRGDRIEFELTETVGERPRRIRFSGVVEKDAIRGTAAAPPPLGVRSWRAVRFSSPLMAPRARWRTGPGAGGGNGARAAAVGFGEIHAGGSR